MVRCEDNGEVDGVRYANNGVVCLALPCLAWALSGLGLAYSGIGYGLVSTRCENVICSILMFVYIN